MVSGGNASSLPLVGGSSEPTIRELSRPGRRASKYPKLDVPEVDINHSAIKNEKAPLPEVSEHDLVMHYSRLAHRNFAVDEIKGLINCIGSIYLRPLHGSNIEDFHSVINTNLFSSYYLLSAFARKMKNGSALFFSSVAATKGLSNHELISAAKAGIEGMARSAAASYAKDNLRVNVIAPSIMDTNMSSKILSSEAAIEMSKSMHPIPKIGDSSDILPVVRWLLSDESKWVTGQTIHVDGGFSTVKPR